MKNQSLWVIVGNHAQQKKATLTAWLLVRSKAELFCAHFLDQFVCFIDMFHLP